MASLLFSSILVSLLHAIIPNHWLPILAISKKEQWSRAETLQVTFLAALAHVMSTAAIGFALAWLGVQIGQFVEGFLRVVAPSILVLLGLFFIWQHYRHHHFHIHEKELIGMKPKHQLVWSLALMMAFSPCLEVEGFFLTAGHFGWPFVALLALVYGLVTIVGMVLWMYVALRGIERLDWHKIEHNAGLLTGTVLILTGVYMLF